jgi:alpha-methylacyl-CoA racemase
MGAPSAGPLSGIRILEVGGIGPVPFCGMVLSSLGADVLRIRRPTRQDPDEVVTAADQTLVHGRPTMDLDLKGAGAVGVALKLIRGADGLIEGLRPGVMERLGLGPDECFEKNPTLVYGRMTGWGQDGPYAQLPGHDINYLALSGILAAIGPADVPPVPPLNLVADFGGGMMLAAGMMAGIVAADRRGCGHVIDASMTEGSALLMTMMYELLNLGSWELGRESNMNDGGAPFYGTYQTADGKFVAIGAMERRFFAELTQRLGLRPEDLPDQWDRQRWPELREVLRTTFLKRSRADWCDLLEDAPVCFTPVLDMTEAPLHPHNRARGTFVQRNAQFVPAAAPRMHARGPSLDPQSQSGRDAAEVLGAFGLSDIEIDDLRLKGVITS